MSGGLRVFGHPIHPMVAGFPVAFWVGASLWDLVALWDPGPFWPRLAFWTLALGVAAAVPAVATGFWELMSLGDNPVAERVAWWHMSLMSTAFCCCLVSLLLRRGTSEAPWSAVVLAAVGALLTLGGGWLGGELVFRHGLAVEKREDR